MSRDLVKTATPGIYRRGDRYVVVLRDRSGKQFKRFAPTLAAARALKATLSADLTRGELVDTRRVGFAAYAEEWIQTYSGRTGRGLREQTRRDYASAIRRNAIPFFGDRQLVDIQPRDIKRYATTLADRGLANNTIRLQLAPLRTLLATAVEEGLLRSNPAAGIRVTMGRRAQDESLQRGLSEAELARVLANVPAEHLLLFELLAQTGLRIGEAIALQWRDIDLVGGRIHVHRRYHKGTVDTPKSKYGIRVLPITQAMRDRLARSAAESRHEHVFVSRNGTPLSPRNLLDRVMKPAARSAGLPWVGLHTLRHTCASRLFRAGWNAKQVQLMLGHHSPAFTLATYVHVMPDDLPEPRFDLGQSA